MSTRAILVVAMMTGRLTLPCTVAGQAQAVWFGTWTLNVAKSTYIPGPPPHTRATCTIEPWKDGVKVTYDMVRTRGGITHLEWTGTFDGRDYRVHGVDNVVTYAYSRVDDHTYEVVIKVDGEVTSTSRMMMSPDGKTVTTVTIGENAQQNLNTTTVYEKQ